MGFRLLLEFLLVTLGDKDDKEFMNNLYKNYYWLIRKTIFNITLDNNCIEDLLNDTFIKLIEKVSLLRNLSCNKIATYLIYTARSISINYLKYKNVENKYLYYGEDSDMTEDIYIIDDTEELLVHQEEIELLQYVIIKLPQKQKDILYLKYILKMKDEVIAREFRITTGSVRQYLTRARRKAKIAFEKR